MLIVDIPIKILSNFITDFFLASDQVGLEPIFGATRLVYQESKQRNQSDMAALMLMFSVKGPLVNKNFGYGSNFSMSLMLLFSGI